MTTYNTHVHKSTGKTPHELVFGQPLKIPNSFIKPQPKAYYTDLSREITTKLRTIRETSRENQIKAKEKSKAQCDKTHNRQHGFNENDLVLLYNSIAKNTSKRLCKDYKGPYKIIQIHDK